MATRKLGFSPLMAAIYSRIHTGALTSTYSIYNMAPRSATFPYVTLGSPIGVKSESYSSRDYEYEDNVVSVHVWSAYNGDKECAEMMDNIVQTVLGTALTITGYETPIDARLDMSEIFVDTSDPERPVRHGVIRFRFHMISST